MYYRIGRFSQSGERLGRTQPAISLQVKKLEGQLNKKLFDKVGQRYQVNKDGKWLYQQAKTMLAINDNIFSEFDQAKLRGRLRLGIPSEFASTLLPSIIGEFNARYPDVSLDVTSALSRHLLNVNNRNSFDVILALQESTQTTEGELLLIDELVWVGTANQLFNKQKLSLVLAPDGCMYRSHAITALKQQTIEWKIAYTNTDLYGLTAAIQQGLGITVLARSSVPRELEIIKSPLLPNLGTINICLFEQGQQAEKARGALSKFIRDRIG